MTVKTKKLFYVRIDFIDLMDFATDPEGQNMSLLEFAKELKKGQSKYPQIQRIINEAHSYIEQKKIAGKESAKKRAKKAQELAEIEAQKQVNAVQHRSSDVQTQVNGDRTNNSNNNSNSTDLISSKGQSVIKGVFPFDSPNNPF